MLYSHFSPIYPYLAFHGSLWIADSHNIFFTLALGFALLWAREALKKRSYAVRFLVLPLLIASMFISERLGFDYGAVGILCIYLFALARDYPKFRTFFWFSALSVLAFPFTNVITLCVYFTIIPLALYNGEKGQRLNKYVSYIFYPAHLLILCAISQIV